MSDKGLEVIGYVVYEGHGGTSLVFDLPRRETRGFKELVTKESALLAVEAEREKHQKLINALIKCDEEFTSIEGSRIWQWLSLMDDEWLCQYLKEICHP